MIMPTRKKPATRVVNIRLTEGDLKTIDAIAKRESRTRANLLAALIRQAHTTRSAKVKDTH